MSGKLDDFLKRIQCDESDEVIIIKVQDHECTILAKFLETWKGLILKYGKENLLGEIALALDRLITNSDFETALMVVSEFQDRLMELKFGKHLTEVEKERLRKLGWEI